MSEVTIGRMRREIERAFKATRSLTISRIREIADDLSLAATIGEYPDARVVVVLHVRPGACPTILTRSGELPDQVLARLVRLASEVIEEARTAGIRVDVCS